MKHIYNVSGMTCGGCSASVEKQLSSLIAVKNAVVNLEKNEVSIEMKSHIPLEELQSVLAAKFVISEKESKKLPLNLESPIEKSEIKQLFPLFLIFGYITVAAILMSIDSWNYKDFMLDFMGLFYIVFSFFKFLDVKGFSTSFKMYDPLAKLIPIYGAVYPFIELTLGFLFLLRFEIPIALILTIIILGITTFGVTKSLLNKKVIKCACLGSVLNLPMTKATFIENTIMILMAVILLFRVL